MALQGMKSDSPVDAPGELRDPCQPWRETLRFQPQLQMSTSAPTVTTEESRGAPRDSRGDWTSLRPHKRVPEVVVVTQEESHCNSSKTWRLSPQLELRYFSSVSSQEKSLSLLSPERALDTLEATEEVPRHPCLLSRGTPRVHQQLKKSPGSPSSSREESPFPCFVGEGIPVFPLQWMIKRFTLEAPEDLPGRATISKVLR